MVLSALAGPKPGLAVSGLLEANVALSRCGLCSPSDYLRRSFAPAFLAGHRPRITGGAHRPPKTRLAFPKPVPGCVFPRRRFCDG